LDVIGHVGSDFKSIVRHEFFLYSIFVMLVYCRYNASTYLRSL